METKQISLAILVLLAMVSCDDTTVTFLEGKAKQDGKVISSTSTPGVVDTSRGDYVIDMRVLEVLYDPIVESDVFYCVPLIKRTGDVIPVRVRASDCYTSLKMVNPNDTITIWVHPCWDCMDKMNLFYPPCYENGSSDLKAPT